MLNIYQHTAVQHSTKTKQKLVEIVLPKPSAPLIGENKRCVLCFADIPNRWSSDGHSDNKYSNEGGNGINEISLGVAIYKLGLIIDVAMELYSPVLFGDDRDSRIVGASCQ